MSGTFKEICVRTYLPEDHAAWLAMRKALWSESSEADANDWVARRDAVTLLAEDTKHHALVGFVEVGQRTYADGCETSPVAFLEAWYVLPEMRGMGIGLKLVNAAIVWAKRAQFHEFASDSLLDDSVAHAAHLAVGFKEVERSIKYRLALDQAHDVD